VKRAIRSFWMRTMGYREFIGTVVIIALLVWRITEGDRSWFVGALASMVAFSIVMPVAIYVSHYRSTMGRFRKMREPIAEFVAEEDSLALASDLGTTTLKWSAVTEVWRFESLWLLMLSKSQFVTLPLEGIPESMQTFILDRVKAAGGKIAG
jgi:hypothetical protein